MSGEKKIEKYEKQAKLWKVLSCVLWVAAAALAVFVVAALYAVVWSILHHREYNDWLITTLLNAVMFCVTAFFAAVTWSNHDASLRRKMEAEKDAHRREMERKVDEAMAESAEAITERIGSMNPEELAEYHNEIDRRREVRTRSRF